MEFGRDLFVLDDEVQGEVVDDGNHDREDCSGFDAPVAKLDLAYFAFLAAIGNL